MALPREAPADNVTAVSAALAQMSPNEKANLPPLDDDDFRLFGVISQHFCFIDFNLRRSLEIMRMAKRLPPEHVKKYPNYSDADLAGILIQTVKGLDPTVENLEEALSRLGEINHCRGYRNLISHFAGKRYPNEDVYVFASKSERDAKKVLGRSLDDHWAHFAVTGRSEFFQLAELLGGHQRWLSFKVVEWDKRYLKK